MADLVTGEAVVLELRLAKLPSRMLALLLDALAQLAALFAGGLVLAGALEGVDEALAAALGLVLVVAVLLGYPVAFETLTRGRTLGKLALGLRAVRDDGGPIRFRHAFLRGLVGVVELWALTGLPAVITSLASRRGKRLGDLLAGTVVVRERLPVHGAPMAAMPPALAGWAAQLELSRLPDDLALAARQFLARLPQLAPEARESMAARLAGAVAATVSPPPPPGVPPVAYLSAVLAERRNRDLARLQQRSSGHPGVAVPPPYAPPYVPPPAPPAGPFAPPS